MIIVVERSKDAFVSPPALARITPAWYPTCSGVMLKPHICCKKLSFLYHQTFVVFNDLSVLALWFNLTKGLLVVSLDCEECFNPLAL